MVLLVLACVLVSFLIGGIPFGFLAGRLLLGDDIRRHGSGNTGATNVWRVLGWQAGVLVLLLDALKGLSLIHI
jgi:glycerol-3-phosphate acyltransferase PlsY